MRDRNGFVLHKRIRTNRLVLALFPGQRPGLAACLKALRAEDTLMVWKLERLGRDLRNLINTVHDLTVSGIGLKVLTGHGAEIESTTTSGKLVFGIFAALAEFERKLIAERTRAGLACARARARNGGRPFKMTAAKVRLAMAAMGQLETEVDALCKELQISRQTLYRHVGPNGEVRPDGERLLKLRPSA
jgi:DNA invertase Pin-like site-specific DNA recombinase